MSAFPLCGTVLQKREGMIHCVYLREHKHTQHLSIDHSPLSTTVRTPGPTDEEEDTNTDE